jgi:streptogrisin C
MDRTIARRLAAVAISAGVVAVLTTPTGAAAEPAGPAGAAPAGVELATPAMLATMQRDLGLNPDAALDRLASDLAASETEATLRASLDGTFGGAWIEDGEQLVVAVTDPARIAEVRAAGAEPRLVTRSENALNTVVSGLNRAETPSAAEVYGWHVDVATNQVVVEAAPGAVAEAAAWVAASGVDGGAVRVEPSTQAPQLLFDVIGGYPYFPGSFRCSIGFSVVGGFVTAGHCGDEGTTTRGYNQAPQGVVAGSSFPGNDHAWVDVNSNWVPRPWVYRWDGTVWVVNGSQEAATGATVCRSGSTTGLHCGQITNKNQTVNYPQGTVFGLTRTTVCAEGGDSGGSFVAAGITAQGVTSGGSGNCTFGGITFYQPVNEILNTYGLTLVTG